MFLEISKSKICVRDNCITDIIFIHSYICLNILLTLFCSNFPYGCRHLIPLRGKKSSMYISYSIIHIFQKWNKYVSSQNIQQHQHQTVIWGWEEKKEKEKKRRERKRFSDSYFYYYYHHRTEFLRSFFFSSSSYFVLFSWRIWCDLLMRRWKLIFFWLPLFHHFSSYFWEIFVYICGWWGKKGTKKSLAFCA